MKIPRVSLAFIGLFIGCRLVFEERKEQIYPKRGPTHQSAFLFGAKLGIRGQENHRFSHRQRTIRAVARGPTHPTQASRLL